MSQLEICAESWSIRRKLTTLVMGEKDVREQDAELCGEGLRKRLSGVWAGTPWIENTLAPKFETLGYARAARLSKTHAYEMYAIWELHACEMYAL